MPNHHRDYPPEWDQPDYEGEDTDTLEEYRDTLRDPDILAHTPRRKEMTANLRRIESILEGRRVGQFPTKRQKP